MKSFRCVSIGLILAFAIGVYPALAQVKELPGTYERKDGQNGGGGIEVAGKADVVKFTVQIGGRPNGAATHPDCGFIAEGAIEEGIFARSR